MPAGFPQALRVRAVLPLLAALALPVMLTALSAPQTRAQTEGTVRLAPAMSNVPLEEGAFTVFIVAEDLQHFGAIMYDDDRDTVPDRQEESNGLAAFEFTIEYDPALLALGDIERGPDLGRTGRSFQCLGPAQEPGRFSYGCLSPGPAPAGPQGTLTLATVELVPLSRGLSPLVLEAGLAGPLGDSVTVDVSGGAVRVTGGREPEPTRTPRAIATLVPVAGTPTAPPAAGTQVPPATATVEDSRQGTPTGTPTAGDRDRPTGGPTPRNKPVEDGSSGGNTVLWSVVAVVGALVVGAGGLAAVLWQRRRNQGGA